LNAITDLTSRIDLPAVAVQFVVLLFSLTLHEAAHAWTASRFGDHTARLLGRVSLDPRRHIDPIGTLLFPLLQLVTNLPLIGWAKPVPVNRSRLRRPEKDQMLVSLAGPGANLLAAAASMALLVSLKFLSPQTGAMVDRMVLTQSFAQPQSVLAPIVGLLVFTLVVNLALALFNLLPIPPLDGHWMLHGLLPYNASRALERFASYGLLLLYGLMFLGAFRYLFVPVQWALLMLLAL